MTNMVDKICPFRYILTFVILLIIFSFYSCGHDGGEKNPTPETVNGDGFVELTLFDEHINEPISNVEVLLTVFNSSKGTYIKSDDEGIILIAELNKDSFPITFNIDDENYFEKSVTIETRNELPSTINFVRKRTGWEGGVMNMDDKTLDECRIHTEPPIGIFVETGEDGIFELISDNIDEDTIYRIVVEHRDYEIGEWTNIKSQKNSIISLGWKQLQSKIEIKPDLEENPNGGSRFRQNQPLPKPLDE